MTFATVDGGWSIWTNWSVCSSACDQGFQMRIRVCSNPAPSNGGQDCVGEKLESQTCTVTPCPGKTEGVQILYTFTISLLSHLLSI